MSRRCPQPANGMHVCVLSPHLDDGVISIGAVLSYLALKRGHRVTIVTVFGGAFDEGGAASTWDRACGFKTRAQAADERRREDRAAASRVGAAAVWLPFWGSEYGAEHPDPDVAEAIIEACVGCDIVAVPAFPLRHPDHSTVANVAANSLSLHAVIGYGEEPYGVLQHAAGAGRVSHGTAVGPRAGVRVAAGALRERAERVRHRGLPGPMVFPGWIRSQPPLVSWRAKWAAIGCYRSQLRAFSPLMRSSLMGTQLVAGGELLWLPPATAVCPRVRAFLAEVSAVSRSVGGSWLPPGPPWGGYAA